MELRQLRHFVALAEEMHFGRASDRLCITQPALSASVARLEDDLGVRLFERDSKGVRITHAGTQLLDQARAMLSQAERTKSFARALSSGGRGRLDIGFSGHVLNREVDGVINKCRRDAPDVEIVLHELSLQTQAEQLRDGRLDAGLLVFPPPVPGLEHIELHEDCLVVCLPANHALAGCRSIDIAQLRDESFVVRRKAFSPSIRDELLGLCAMAGFQPRIATEAGHSMSNVSLVARGLGVALVLGTSAEFGIPGVVFRPLAHKQPRRHTYFVWNAQRMAPGLEVLVDGFRAFTAGRGRRVVPLRGRRAR